MMRRAALGVSVLWALAAIGLSSCGTFPHCPPGQQAVVQEQLYFGTDRPGGKVGAQEWEQFLAEVVTPRFPDGLTAWNASGQWRAASGDIVREASHVLNLIHPPGAASDAAVEQVMSEYKTRFAQEAVLRVRSRACSSL